MKLNNGFWEDENHNKWNSSLYSEKAALKYSSTLTDCRNCSNCSNCSYCRDCNHCKGCSYCRNCNYCSGCNHCKHCIYCSSCNHCRNCNDCWDCKNCSYCRDCSYCKGCSYCDSFSHNPERIIGSVMYPTRSDNPAVYWTEVGKEQCVVDCFRGTLDEFEKTVEKTHKDNPVYLEQYRKFIKAVRTYQGVMT